MASSKGLIMVLTVALMFSPATALPLAKVAHQALRRGLQSPSNLELLHNIIVFGVPATLSFLLRLINRIWVMKGMQLEDWIMVVTFFFYVSLLTFINADARYATNLFPPEQLAGILADPVNKSNRIVGSMLVIPLEQSMLFCTWGVKLSIWHFLRRCCRQLPNYQICLDLLLGYIIVSFAFIEIMYFGVLCRPFSQYWAVPVQNEQCATYQHYSIIQMIFNISSDLALIIIPLRMITKAKLPKKRKLVLLFLFCLAGFTIIAAILNKYSNFQSPLTTIYQLWYIREASVAVCVGNLICTWQLLQRLFSVRSFDNRNAGIENQPPIPVRDNENSVRSVGGTPRSLAWRGNWMSRKINNFNFSVLTGGRTTTRTENLTSATTKVDETEDFYKSKGDRNYFFKNRHSSCTRSGSASRSENFPMTTTNVMTLNQDGDDATHAINYRNQNQIS